MTSPAWFDDVLAILRTPPTPAHDDVPPLPDDVSDGVPPLFESFVVDRGELTLHVSPDHLADVLSILRDHPDLRFDLSLGVSGVHYPDQEGRELHAVYHLRSITHEARSIRVEVAVALADPHIPSTVAIYPTHDWHERETFDLLGIIFDDHPSLARILMPDDWVGHPLRKDYPLGGIGVQFSSGSVPPRDHRRGEGK